jgi:hypothetical protein
MKKLLFLGACLVALASSPAMAQTGGADIVTMKVKESFGTLQIIISRSTGKPEVLNFPQKDLKEDGAIEAATQQVIAKLYQEGYALKGSFGGSYPASGTRSTLVFTKGQ